MAPWGASSSGAPAAATRNSRAASSLEATVDGLDGTPFSVGEFVAHDFSASSGQGRESRLGSHLQPDSCINGGWVAMRPKVRHALCSPLSSSAWTLELTFP